MSKLLTTERNALQPGSFAFPNERKLPLEDAFHVRNAIARFDQVEGVSDDERDIAWRRIEAASKLHGIEIHETRSRDVGGSKR